MTFPVANFLQEINGAILFDFFCNFRDWSLFYFAILFNDIIEKNLIALAFTVQVVMLRQISSRSC